MSACIYDLTQINLLLSEIVNLQPFISTYYDATQDLIDNQQDMVKGLSGIKERQKLIRHYDEAATIEEASLTPEQEAAREQWTAE
jgi:hypothetical protein